mmetsp:Transcript_81794/g.205810  ORF Transcript_81794/g.205810 Transcript_81794/m.205810 type:complete len:217 (+) Transcript_81794:423-1073(+)
MRVGTSVGHDLRLVGVTDGATILIHYSKFDVRVRAASAGAVGIPQVLGPFEPDGQHALGASHATPLLSQEHRLQLLVSVLRSIHWVPVKLPPSKHVVDVAVAFLLSHVFEGGTPELVPILIQHLLRLLLAVDDDAPLCQVSDVKVLGADVVGDVVHDEELRMIPRFAPLLPIHVATTAAQVGDPEVHTNQACESVFLGIWEMLLDGLDYFRCDILA